jgi:anti-anti-sigma factor
MVGLSIAEDQSGDKRILRLEGQLDAQTYVSLEKEIDALFNLQHKKVVLNFAKVSEVSPDSLQMLFSETKKFKEGKGSLGLSNVSPDLMQRIREAGLDRSLLIYHNEPDAILAMGG